MAFTTQYNLVAQCVTKVVTFKERDNGVRLASVGTGTIVNDGSMILTCAHCVDENVNSGILINNNIFRCESLIKDNNLDIAILKFNQKVGKPVPICSASDSNDIKIGDDSFVVGYPLNCKDQVLLPSTISSLSTESIRIASNVNHGNSGGPLFNTNGDQIGVVNAKHGKLSELLEQFSQLPVPSMTINGVNTWEVLQQIIHEMSQNLNLGLGYAIPINYIRMVSPELKQYL